MMSEGIEQHRQRQREVGSPFHQPQDQRQKEHQHDIERQHVDVQRPKSQQQDLKQHGARVLEKFDDAHFVQVQRVADAGRDIGNFRDVDGDEEHMRQIDLPDPPHDARGRDQPAGFLHGAAIHERRGVAGDENENLGGVAESVTADREPGQNIGRDMVDEDQPQRQAAEQIDPQFPLGRGTRNRRCRGGRRRGGVRDRARGARGGWCGIQIGNRRHLAPSRAHRLTRSTRSQPPNRASGHEILRRHAMIKKLSLPANSAGPRYDFSRRPMLRKCQRGSGLSRSG